MHPQQVNYKGECSSMTQDFIEAVLADFSESTQGQKRAADKVFEYLYFHLHEFNVYYREEDQRSDFLLWLYPQLPRIIGKYNPQLSLFFTYLKMSLKFYHQLFERKRHQRQTYDIAVTGEQKYHFEGKLKEQDASRSYEIYAASPEPEYAIAPEKERAIKNTVAWESKKDDIYKRSLLLLACKSCFFIDGCLQRRLAEVLEIPEKEVAAILCRAKCEAAAKENIYKTLTETRDRYYFRYKCATLQLTAVDETHPALFQKLKTQQSYNYALWQRFLKRAREYSRMPSNRSLAKQLGLSRGTVDTNLAVLKKACYGKA